MFAYVKCHCGRTLRAQRSPTRTTIRCWDCQAEVRVPRFRSPEGPGPIGRLRGAVGSAQGETAAGIILLALAVTAVIAVPRFGGWLALAVLIGAALVYLRRIEAPGRAEEFSATPDRPVDSLAARFGRRVARLGLATAFVVGLVAPAWIADGSRQLEHVPPALPVPGLLIVMLALWIVLPLIVFVVIARDETGPIGPSRALIAAWRRRWSMLAALLTPLLVIAALEGTLLGVLTWTDRLPTVVMDVFPLPEGYRVRTGLVISDEGQVVTRTNDALPVYAEGLLRGATLAGSVPISFCRGPEPRIIAMALGSFKSEGYLLARLGITVATMLSIFGAFGIQSALFGRIGLTAPKPEHAIDSEAETDVEPEPEPEPEAEPEPAVAEHDQPVAASGEPGRVG